MAFTIASRDIEILRYEDRYRHQSMEVLRRSFFLHESVCIGSEVNITPQAQCDLELLCTEVANRGVTLIARHSPTDTILGVAFNILQTLNQRDANSYFEQFHDSKCTTDSSRSVLNYMIAMDAKVNLFEMYNVSCVLDIMYLSTLPAYAGHGIATKLVEQSIQLAEDLKTGKTVLNSSNSRPQLISALFSSRISQRVGEKIGFQFIKEVPHSEFIFRAFVDVSFTAHTTNYVRSEHALMFLSNLFGPWWLLGKTIPITMDSKK
uniref:N-acetyltransferase domain-containing protein n=1 Tax=Anopheles culicifacies TaxID=139723 RepID=A0A182LUL8_9DIPT